MPFWKMYILLFPFLYECFLISNYIYIKLAIRSYSTIFYLYLILINTNVNI